MEFRERTTFAHANTSSSDQTVARPLPVAPSGITSAEPPELGLLPAVEIPAVYVHVPFCFHKCHYCDFYSITGQSTERMDGFVRRVLHEASIWQRNTTTHVRPRTIFFGGGTPSLLPPEQMRQLILGLRERFDFSQVNEFTVEVNPATATIDFCRTLRELGVDRMSLGAQSFDPAELKVLEREHDPSDVARSLEIARAAGFERLSLDLIFAIPGQSLESWDRSLSAALKLGVDHLSCYGLTYEPNTALAVRRRLGRVRAVAEDLEVTMLHHTRRRLIDSGFEAYEISNFARPGQACRHNQNYWLGGSYVGLGPSAASHVEGHRFKNRSHLGAWERAVDSDTLPVEEYERLAPKQRAGELAWLMLRTAEGVDYDRLAERTGHDAADDLRPTIAPLVNSGLLEPTDRGFRLTNAGLPLADAIAARLLSC